MPVGGGLPHGQQYPEHQHDRAPPGTGPRRRPGSCPRTDEGLGLVRELGAHRRDHLCHRGIDQRPGTDHHGRDGLVAPGGLADPRRRGRVGPDVVLHGLDTGPPQARPQPPAVRASRSPQDLDPGRCRRRVHRLVGRLVHYVSSSRESACPVCWAGNPDRAEPIPAVTASSRSRGPLARAGERLRRDARVGGQRRDGAPRGTAGVAVDPVDDRGVEPGLPGQPHPVQPAHR